MSTVSIYHSLAGSLVRRGRPNLGGLVGLGPRPVSLTTQGTVRTASSLASIATAYAASAPGDTIVVDNGSYGALTLARNLASGDVRILPATAGGVTFTRVDVSGAVGLDIRGINTSDEVYYATSSRIKWRGGVFNPTTPYGPTGHNIRESCYDILIEDTTLNNADCSFFVYADRDSLASDLIVIRHVRSNNVGQDHLFGSRGTHVTVEDSEFYGHTEDAEHQDGFQVVGLKDFTVQRNHYWNSRAFRDGASDRNDHAFMVNYTPGEVGGGGTAGRIPERGLIENNLIHDMTSTGISIAGGLNMKLRYNTVYDVGASGAATAVIFAPDAGNTVSVDEMIGNVLESWSSSGASITTNSHNFVADNSGPAGTSKLSGSPGFVDAANQDYRLTAGSQNRGSGLTSGAPVLDLYSVTRPSPPSRGAIE
jgi:hypothetical protein